MKVRQSKTLDMRALRLSPEEGFVLSRVDGATSVKDLVALTGLDEGRVTDIVARLETQGAIERDAGAATATATANAAPASSAETRPATAVQTKPAKRLEEDDAVEAELRAFLAGEDVQDDERAPEPEQNAPPRSESDVALSAGAEDAPGESSEIAIAKTDDAAPPDEGEAAKDESEATNDESEAAKDESEVLAGEQRNERNYREIYATVYATMPRDARLKAAGEVSGADLLALCFDPDPTIISAIMAGPHAGFAEARLIAFHHRTQAGLEAVSRRSEILRDSVVQRRLLRNPQLPTTLLNRILGPKMLIEVYKAAIDREIPERTRGLAKEVLRKKFTVASSDEKAALLFKTEGRCLILLVQCSLDAHATNILCSKSTYTLLFVQNLARWSATPPALLVHMIKMPIVRRNMGIKKMLLKHPNMPSDAKRNYG